MIFCDTSFAAKLYVPEKESAAVRKLLETEDEVCLSELARPELMGVFHRRLREGKWTRADFLAAVRQFSHDDIGGFWTWLPLAGPIMEAAANTYGPYQFPEKLIPVVILKALRHERIPIYGKGDNVRDWLFVEDHVRALVAAFEQGKPGETYNIGGNSECPNLHLVRNICSLLDNLAPNPPEEGFGSLIGFVPDRPGHDHRYAIDASKIARELHWRPALSLEAGLKRTIRWYLDNQGWCERVTSGKYRQERLGRGDSR